MPATRSKATPELTEYERNRQQFTAAALRPYEGQWVAFSLDGKRIVAAAFDLISLDQSLRESGESISNFGLEQIVFDDIQGNQAEVA